MTEAPAARPLDPELLRLPGEPRIERLDNGLTLCVLTNPQAPLVASALWYRAGSRDEPPGQEGVAHFLEHMMFRGSPLYPPGEIDRLTQAWGGANNAFTSHDATAYHFSFGGRQWREALAVEADRMAALDLDPAAVDLERQVILEELSMYEDQPWDALERRVFREAFGDHPYGRPIIGERESLAAIGAAELGAFHAAHYRPDRAVLVLAGAIGEEGLAVAAEAFGVLPAAGSPRSAVPAAARPAGLRRVSDRRGEVDRLFWLLSAPSPDSEEEGALRLLAAVLATGRASRLQSRLVEEEGLCTWVSADLTDHTGPSVLAIAAEALPGVEGARVEAAIRSELDRVRAEPPTSEEVARAERLLVADRVFGCSRIDQQAMVAGHALALFDWEYPERQARHFLSRSPQELLEAAREWLDPERSSALGCFASER